MSFREIEASLTGLLRHFAAAPGMPYGVPFRYLATGGLWEVPEVSSWSKKHTCGIAGSRVACRGRCIGC